MKKILAIAALVLLNSAQAQSNDGSESFWGTSMGTGQSEASGSGGGNRHMFEFGADSSVFGLLSFDKSKTRGNESDDDTQLNLDLNYAYSLPMYPRLQLGARGLYLKDVNSLGDQENWGAQVGAIFNLSDDLQSSAYASLYLGMLWNHDYGSSQAGDDEVRIGTVAVGKRFNLERWGLKHVTYSPEVALQTRNSTTSSSFDYSQDLQIRFLQFSVFF